MNEELLRIFRDTLGLLRIDPIRSFIDTADAFNRIIRAIRLLVEALEVSSGAGSDGPVIETATLVTTDSTPSLIETIPVTEDSTVFIDARVVCKEENGGAQRGAFAQRISASRVGAAPAVFNGAVNTPFTQRTDSDLNAEFALSGNNVEVYVTGLGASTIAWVAAITTLDVTA